MNEKVKKNKLDKKWIRMEKEGVKRPATPAENQRRIREAHIGS